jgi:hypothetical protein
VATPVSRSQSETPKKFVTGKELQEFPRTKQEFTIVRRVLKLRFSRRLR